MRYKFNEIAINSVEKRIPTEDDKANYIGLEHLESGSLSVSTWGSAVSLKGEKIVMRKGDVLFGKRNTYLRRASIAPHDGLFSAHGMVLRPKPEVIDPSFFPFFVNSDEFFNSTIRISVGSLSPTVNWKDMKELEFDLPPIEKQRELAELLWAANDLKESYKKLITASDEMLKAKFREMFGECGAGKWPLVRFEDVAPSRLGKMLDAKKQTGKWMRPYLANTNVQWFHFDLTELREMDFNEEDQVEFSLEDGDLLVCEGGEVGRCAVWHNELEECYFQKAIHRVRCKPDKLLPDYVAFWFKQETERGSLSSVGKGTTIAHLPGEKLKNLPINLPPLANQQEFVEIARKADETKAALKKSIADVDNVIKGLING